MTEGAMKQDRDIGRAIGRAIGVWLRPVAATMLLVAALAACTPLMRYHGYAPTDAELAQIQVGRDTRETVAQKVGRPGMGGVMQGSAWYYVQSDWQERPLRGPIETDRQVVAISFDSRDRVTNIERFGLADGEVVPISRRVTDSGPRPGVLSQVFRVLGQFTAASFR